MAGAAGGVGPVGGEERGEEGEAEAVGVGAGGGGTAMAAVVTGGEGEGAAGAVEARGGRVKCYELMDVFSALDVDGFP